MPATETTRPRRGPRRSNPLLALVALLAAIVLVGSACNDSGSSDSDSSDGDDQSTSSDNDSGEEEGSDTNGETDGETDGSDTSGTGDFVTDVEAAQQGIESASSACDVIDALETLTTVGDPQSQDETEAAIVFYVAMVNKMAETSSDPALSARLETAADNIDSYAKSVDYDPEALDLNGAGPDYPGAEEDDAALDDWLDAEFTNCVPEMPEEPVS